MASAMAMTDEDLSVMLQSGHASQGHMPMLSSHSMLSSDAMDLLSGQLPFSPLQRTSSMGGPGSMNMGMHRGGLEGSSMSSATGSGGSSIMSQPASQWPFASDEKWELDRKSELLDSATRSFGGAPPQPLNPLSRTQPLQRYHSAPSTFLQCLADFNEEAFSHVNDDAFAFVNSRSPLGNSIEFFNDNLAPIMESAPSGWAKQLQAENTIPRSKAMNSTEQYFAIQADNARQAALRGSENRIPLSRSIDIRSQTLKNNLLRQSSSPAELLSAINAQENNISPTDKRSIAAMHSNPSMNVFNDGSGVWKMPTSPTSNLAGKRVRFPEEISDDSDLLQEDLSRSTSLLRHQSLPTSSTGPLDPAGGVDIGYDDLLDLYGPCKTRARRGYATHPRSIAERNRRSRISERMKKLQDLVPNMDKQTNTADMLDEAVEYVKHLQLQVKDLAATIVQLKIGIRQQPHSG